MMKFIICLLIILCAYLYKQTQELKEGYIDLGFKQVGEFIHTGYKVKAPFLNSDSICFATTGNKEILVVCRKEVNETP